MNFLDITKKRYTTKVYNPEKKVSEQDIEHLQQILHLSPSSINSQPWKFTFIEDTALKDQLAEASFFNKEKIKQASHLVVFSAIDDIDQFEEQIKTHLPEGAVGYYQTMLKPKGEIKVKEWIKHQVYISLGYFLAACAAMGIDSTPMEGIEADKYNKILGLDGYHTLFAVALGYRDETDANQPSLRPKTRIPRTDIVHKK